MEARRVLAFVAVAFAATYAADEVTFPEVFNERSSSRIVSGWEAEAGQFPHQLSIRMVSPIGGVSSCGGSILSESWGLTAAHCTAGRLSFVIRAGAVNLTTPAFIFETTEFHNHPEYDNSIPSIVQPHDIGLISFQRKLDFSGLVQPIRLQRSAAKTNMIEYTDQVLTASGWGRTWTDGSAPENMNWVFLRGVPRLECVTRFVQVASESTICARYYNVTSQSTCQGDSGGVLSVIDDDGQVSQIGISSFVSSSGCHTEIPAGFIQPGYYHEWLTEVTGENYDWTYETDEEDDSDDDDDGDDDGDDDSDDDDSDDDDDVDSVRLVSLE